MVYIGLFLIILSWLLQYFSKGEKLTLSFVVTYAVGVSFITVGSYMEGQLLTALLNFLSLLSAVIVYNKIKK